MGPVSDLGGSPTIYLRFLKRFSFLSLLLGVLAILAVIFIRVFSLFEWIKLYHQALSLHAISMLVFWAPLAMLFFLESKLQETARSLKSPPQTDSLGLRFGFGTLSVALGIIGTWSAYLTNPEIRLTQFILTPNSLPICGFLLVYILGLLVLFTLTGQRLSMIFCACRVEASSKEWVKYTELIFCTGICVMMAINALLTGGFLTQGLLFGQWQEFTWLPLGHLSLQSMTLAAMMIWGSSMGRTPSPSQAQFKFICFAGYPIFSLFGVLHLLPLFFSSAPSNLWQDQFIWIPAFSSLGLTLLLAIQFLQKKNYVPTKLLSDFIWRWSFITASLLGGVSGLLIGGDKSVKAKVLGTLFMPGHFHPLVLGGVTLTLLGYFISKQEPFSEKGRRIMTFLVISLVVGLSLLSGVLMTSGWLWKSARRFPVLMGTWPSLQNALIAAFGLVTALSLIFILVLVFLQKNKHEP